MKSPTLQTINDTIRDATELAELRRLAGPSNEETSAAEQRLRTLDALSPACEWDRPVSHSKGARCPRTLEPHRGRAGGLRERLLLTPSGLQSQAISQS